MKNIMKVILCGLLLLTLPILATAEQSTKPSATPASKVQLTYQSSDISIDLKLQQQQLEFFKVRLDQQDKRIGDLALYLAFFGVLMTVIVVFFSFRSTKEAVLAAKDDARKEVKEQAKIIIEAWLGKDGQKLLTEKVEASLRPEVSKALDEIRNVATEVISGLKDERSRAHDHNAKQEQLNEQYERVISDLAARSIDKDKSLTAEQRKIVESAASKKLEFKAPIEYKFDDWFTLGNEAFNASKFEVAADHYAKAAIADTNSIHQAMALRNKGVALGRMERREESIAVNDEVLRRFGEATETALREQVAGVLRNKGVTLGQMGLHEEEFAAYDEVLRRFGNAKEPMIREQVAKALVNKGIALDGMKQHEAAIAVYEEVIRRFGEAAEVAVLREFAKALFRKGVALGELARGEAAIAVYEEMLHRFGKASDEELRVLVAKSLLNKSYMLDKMGLREEKVVAQDEVLQRFGDATEKALREQVSMALNSRGFDLLCDAKKIWKEGDKSRAVELLKQAMDKIEGSLERRPDAWVPLGNKGYILYLQGRNEEARNILKKALVLGGERFRQAELDDADIHSLPQDEVFREMIKSL